MNVLKTSLAARFVGFGLALFVLTGCDKIKGMLQKDNGTPDAAVAVVDAGPVVAAAPEDAGPPDAGAVQAAEDLPSPDFEEGKANRDIGFGNYKDEIDKLEKEVDKEAAKKK